MKKSIKNLHLVATARSKNLKKFALKNLSSEVFCHICIPFKLLSKLYCYTTDIQTFISFRG
jgi:hypothetical protein